MADTDYWKEQSLRYSEPHYRLLKCANLINDICQGTSCDLLDVGCGPSTLSRYLRGNIHYYGIDLVIPRPAPNLIQANLAEQKIEFGDRTFDLISAFGFFEYIGDLQHQKLLEIDRILKPSGRFVTSFLNFRHRHAILQPAYNNMISIPEFSKDLGSLFHVDRIIPTSYNWVGTEPRRKWLSRLQMPLKINIPPLSSSLGVQFIFICSKAKSLAV